MPIRRAEIPLTIDKESNIALPRQIATRIRQLINDGTLQPGDALPGTRRIAENLGISRGSVTSAFDQLYAEGYLLSAPGAPTRVHPDLVAATKVVAKPKQLALPRPKIRISLKPSTATTQNVRPAAWRAAWRAAAGASEGRLEPAGQPQLREAIAEHIRLSRSMAVASNSVLVTGGSREGLMLIVMALADAYGRRLTVGVEDPGHPGLRAIVSLLGHEVIECPIDVDGVLIESLPEDLDLLLVTPSYLYPLGSTMPAARKSALLRWAQEFNTVLVEDDFNAELRYRLAPEPALAAQADDHGAPVIVLGTFSTLLAPSLSAGYVLAPPQLMDTLLDTRQRLGMPVAGVTQRAIAELLTNGYVRKHTRAMHLSLGRRKAHMEQIFSALVTYEDMTITTMGSGVDYFLGFADSERAQRFEHLMQKAGIGMGHAEKLWSAFSPEHGFILSFAHLSENDFAYSLDAITHALEASRL